ncbi:MAG: GAF domain-containing protein [Acidobacteriota bacterium]
MKEILKDLDILTQDRLDDATRAKLLDQTTEKVGNFIAKTYSVKDHEVAIMLVSPKQRALKFEFPKAHRGSGVIPVRGRVSGKDSIALRAINTKRAELLNSVKNVKHLALFEQVKHADKAPVPIQKMMCAPVVTGDLVVGVIQVSRKGESEAAAGPDFSDDDLRQLQEIATEFAPYLGKLIPTSY